MLLGQMQAIRVVGGADAGLFYVATDHLGSVASTFNSAGQRQGSPRLYYPFGEERAGTDPAGTERGYTGHQENDYIKLIYMGARFYLPSAGRFLTADTIVPNHMNPQSFNRYSYVNNNPINYNDPSGHCIFGIDTAVCVAIAIGAGVGLIVDYGTQVFSNMNNEGMNFFDAVYYPNIDWSRTAGATAAGGVGGGIAAPISGLAGPSLISRLAWSGTGGAIGGAVAGQTNSLVQATVQEVDSYYRGYGFVDDRLFENAADSGFLDPNSMLIDAGTGIVFAFAGDLLKSALSGSGHLADDALTPIIKMEPVLGQGVQGKIMMVDGRVITMTPIQLQAFMQGLKNGGKEFATDVFIELLGTQTPEEQ